MEYPPLGEVELPASLSADSDVHIQQLFGEDFMIRI